MTPDTPLTEVAHHLSREGAGALSAFPIEIQVSTLTQLRTIIVFWEEHEVRLDPIAYQAAVDAVVGSLAPLYLKIYQQSFELNQLAMLLAGGQP